MLLRRIRDACQGSIAPIFAVSLVPVLGLMGASVDYRNAVAARTAMQAALDAAVLAAAKEAPSLSVNQVTQKASDYFTSGFTRSDANNVQMSADYVSGNVTARATATVRSAFMRVFNVQDMPVAARAVAAIAKIGNGCVLSLGSGVAASVQGTADVVLSGCNLYDNSSDSSALTVGGSGRITAPAVFVAGGISGRTSITASQGIYTGMAPLADPYASVSYPAFSGCTDNNLNVNRDATIGPGVYCNGISVRAGATLTLNPGIYYIDRGSFSVNGGGTVNGTGVTLVFTSSTGNNYASASINGGANINLTAPTTGETAGIVFFGDRNMPVGTSFDFKGGATQTLVGTIYAPRAAVSFAGGADTGDGCTKLVANTVSFTGNSNFAINCTGMPTKQIGSLPSRLTS